MTGALRMLWFHVRMFARNTYFSQLMITSTLSIVVLQLLAAHGNNVPTSEPIWLRAGMVGAWTVCTVAAGMIGFQRFQGTLVHLVMTPMSASRVLLPLVASAATFGLLAFPLAALASTVFGYAPVVVSWPTLAAGIFAFWIACLAISALVSSIFVLTPNAITYEGLLAVPLILLSGIFDLPTGIPKAVVAFTYVLPTTPAVRLILDQPTGQHFVWLSLGTLGLSAAWFGVSLWAMSSAERRAKVSGTLEVV